jgi:hypothetical protein
MHKGWIFSRNNLFWSEIPEWERFYLPIDVDGLAVLDVGAGEGETAKFFLEHGASKVICIESDNMAFRLLKINARERPIFALYKRFELADLDMNFDFMKMDIEGYEEVLLQTRLTKPSVLEVHGLQLRDKFEKQGWNIKYKVPSSRREASPLCYAYKNIPMHRKNGNTK